MGALGTSSSTADGRRAATGSFAPALALLTLLALAIRLVYALAVAPGQIQPGDSLVYHTLADALADGRGYTLTDRDLPDLVPSVGTPLYERSQPTASHPPLYPLYLAAFTKLGLASFAAHRVASSLLGALAVALIGLLGRRVAGERVGLVAAGLAAVYPQLFMIDGTLIAESLFAPLLVLVLLLAYGLLERPTWGRAAAMGAVIGLATLTRSEGVLLLLLLVPAAAWAAGRDRWRLMAVALAMAALVLSPWLVRNWIRFDRVPLLSTNGALTQLATNCTATYYGPRIGFVAHECALRSTCLRIREEVPQSECLLREAREFVGDHLGRVPVVLLARLGREWNVHDPATDRNYGMIWARERTWATIGMAMYALLAVLAVGGLVSLRRRGVPVGPMLAMVGLAMLAALIAFGFSRYRLAAEPALLVLAAVAIDSIARRHRSRRRAPDAATRVSEPVAGGA
jgi:4-amino-4-deoxy-L-arabinose transferase-like glycosyltransferase